jgi:hypothetical protein
MKHWTIKAHYFYLDNQCFVPIWYSISKYFCPNRKSKSMKEMHNLEINNNNNLQQQKFPVAFFSVRKFVGNVLNTLCTE